MNLKDPLGELRRSIRHIQDVALGRISSVILERDGPKTNPKDELMWSVELDAHPFEEDRLYVVVMGRFEIPRELAAAMSQRAKTFGSDPIEFWNMSTFFPGMYYAGGLTAVSQSDSAGTAKT